MPTKKAAPKLGVPVTAMSLTLTNDNPDDYVGDRYVPTAPPPAAAAPERSGFIRRVLGDGAVTALKGAIGVPEAAVGLADIATGGAVGSALENKGGMLGFRPKEAKEYLDTFYSPEQQAAFAAVQGAANPQDPLLQRIADTGLAAVQNPSTIVHAVGESLPSMGAGGVIGRGILGLSSRVPGAVAAGLGEGVVSAGSTAEQIRQQTPDGRLTGEQSGLAAASGLAVAGLGMVAAKAAKAMGVGDIDVLMAGGKNVDPALQKGFVRRVLEGAFTEGVLEELPQSIVEQVAQNRALGKPLDEGVDQAAVMGVLSGGAMGVGAQVIRRQPEVGPLSRAANMAAGGIAPTAPDAPGAAPTAPDAPMPPPAPIALDPGQEKELLDHANKRAAELELKAKGSPDTKNADGQVVPGVVKQFLTPEEKSELEFLSQAGGDAQALARAYGAPAPIPAMPEKPIDDQAAIARMERDQRRLEGEALGRSRAAEDEPGVVSGAPREPAAAPAAPAAPVAPEVAAEADDAPDLPMAAQDDILNPRGEPFKERFAARRRQANLPDPQNYDITQVQGGYAIRRKAGAVSTEAPVAQPAPEAAELPTAPTAPEAPIAPQDDATTADILDSDILNPKGDPFKERGAAMVAQKKHPGSELVKVPAGWVVRPQPTGLDAGMQPVEVRPAGTRGTSAADVVAPAATSGNSPTPEAGDIGGEPINDEWKRFPESSGSKGIPRADMPQIKAGDRSSFLQFLRARGIDYEYLAGGDAAKFKPTQAEYSPAKVQQARDFSGETERSILVSNDGYVLDGHHQWLHAMTDRLPVGAIQMDAPIDKLLELAREFPSVGQSEGATPGETTAPEAETAAGGQEGAEGNAPAGDQPPAPPATGDVSFDAAAVSFSEFKPSDAIAAVTKHGLGSMYGSTLGAELDKGDRSKLSGAGVGSILLQAKVVVVTPQGQPEMPVIFSLDGEKQMAAFMARIDAIGRDHPGSAQPPAPPALPEPTGTTAGPGTPAGDAEPKEPKTPKAPKPAPEPEQDEPVDSVATPPDDARIESQPVIDGKVKTTSGRLIDAPPPIRLGDGATERQVQNDIRKVDAWLRKQAINEARARGNKLAEGSFRSVAPNALSPSDKDSMNVFLFGVEAPTFTIQPKADPKAEKPAADSMAELIDGSDAQGIADAAYAGIREAEPEDFPTVLPDDKLIRLPVLVAEHKAVEANLKKLGFRVTDRSQESGTDGRMLVSALYRPEKGGIGDAGEQMAGGRKEQQPRTPLPKEPSEKALDEFLAALHPSKHMDADSNAEQSFGAMMLKEALIENVKYPLDYIADVISKSFRGFYGMRSGRAILKQAMGVDEQRARMEALANEYTERVTLLQATLAPAKRIADVKAAMVAAYTEKTDWEEQIANKAGRDLRLISSMDPIRRMDDIAPRLEPSEDTTDQTHRAKKKDPDVPPRLERIVRIGMKDHRGGKSVADEDFLNSFAFRGLEFGNWVTQIERQENLNLAYDSLMDMADLTGLTPKALGLAKDLGFAIGARGQNPRAAAHFEPDNNVINLTKTKGNGTVGHEWFHALDHNASRLQGDNSRIRSEARSAVNALAGALKTRFKAEDGDAFLRGLLRSAATDSNRNTPPKEAVMKALSGNKRYRYSMPDAYGGMVARQTKFQQAANDMDSGADKKYWSTPVEMLARGFETFLYDKSKGGSPYLVGPTRADGAMTKKNGYSGEPYPSGEERQYVTGLYEEFLALFDGETLAMKAYKPEWTIKHVPDLGWTVLDQHGIDVANSDGHMTVYETEEAAKGAVRSRGDDYEAFLNAERTTFGKLNLHYRDFALRIDAIMEEMGLERWPEVKDGSMAESMFFHLRQGWWPENNQALKVYAGKAYRIEPKDVDLLKLKQAQEDFEAALGRYAGQRVVDMRNEGADDRAIYDYLVSLYNKQPNLDVRTGVSQANMAFSTPIPIGFVAGLMGHVTSKTDTFDPTGGNGMLALTANPKRVVAIELEPHRAKNLRLMEYGKVIEGDAITLIDTAIRPQEADTALMNPPFGTLAQSVAVPSWDGRNFMMGKIDQLIAAKAMKAMADKGRAVIILGAHRNPGTVTSTDRVFLNWLYSNYNVVDHFEVDGDLYARQGANWPLRILVVAGRNQTVSAFDSTIPVGRVYDFDQLWSRADEARERARNVVVGAGVAPDGAGSANPNGAGVPAGDSGEAAGAGGRSGNGAAGAGNSDVADGAAGAGSAADGRPGQSGGSTAGDGQRGGNGAGGSTGNGAAGAEGRSGGGRRGTAGTPPGGLSGLTDDDIDALIGAAMGGKTSAPKGGAKTGRSKRDQDSGPPMVMGDGSELVLRYEDYLKQSGMESMSKESLKGRWLVLTEGLNPYLNDPTGGFASEAEARKWIADQAAANKGAAKKDTPRKPGKSILDDIEGMGDLLDQLGAEFAAPDETPPDGTPTPPKTRKKKEKAIERRDVLVAMRNNAFAPDAGAPLQLGYTPAPHLTGAGLNLLGEYQHSQAALVKSIRAALDYRLEQTENPTAGPEKVSSRAMFSRQLNEDAQYAKVQPILSAIWQRLTAAIADVSKRIQTLVVGAAQKFGNTVVPFVKRFIQDMRSEESRIPNGKKPIRAEAIDNEAQVVYRGRSTGDSSGIFVPRNQAQALERSFDAFEAENGEVDPFVQTELGYDSIEDMHKGPKRGQSQGLAGYQVDALALAISSMKRGDGFIIGDDTGVGKGRTAAALIGWAVKNGKVPIFFSYKSDLYSAMYDDLTDIGMESRVRPLPTDADAVIRNRAGKTILKNNAKTTKKALEHIIATGTMPDGHNALFTTYYQNNVENLRRQAIRKLVIEGKAVIVMDEAHNAAGESSTNEFFMGLLTGKGLFGGTKDGDVTPPPDDWVAPQTTYLTATFAKRASNMPVYVRTQLRHAANTPDELKDLFASGGDVLQQIASEMLVLSGSMIRRERSYAGVKFNYVTDEENAPRDSREVDAATAVLRRVVYADRAFGEWVKTQEGQAAVRTLVPPGYEATHSGSQADTAINKSEFTSVVHNYVGQLLLATKVNKAVQTAVDALNAGQKPVLTLQNTMEAALNDYVGIAGVAEGDPLEGFGWQSILQRGLTSARRVTFNAGTGSKSDNLRLMVPVEMMPSNIAAEFKKAQELIEAFQSDLPGSPIDALRHRLGQFHIVETKGEDGTIVYSATKTPPAGSKSRPLVAVEVTGREFGVDYSTKVPTYMRRADPDNLEIIRGFQGGGIDVVILNSSGSTGISLHASEMARDQRPRHMVVLQPNPDIAVFKQTTGRIHRTGQVEWPTFTVLATGIPAERRQLAMLKKKISSLFSNTSSGEGTTSVDAVDFINLYGDIITAEYLSDNPDVAAFIGVAIPTDPAGSDISRKASGRAALLSVDEQRDYFDTIEQQFLMEIEQRNATGTNALTRRAMDFQASPVEMQVLEEGMDEENPFTASAYLTKYEVNVVGDIPTPEKVKAAIAQALNGGTARDATDRIVASLATRYDEALNQLGLRQAEIGTALADPTGTEQEKRALTDRQTALAATIQGFASRRELTISHLRETWAIGSGVSEMKVGDVEASAVVIGVTAGKATSKVGNPFAPSNIIIHFQRNIPGGRLSVPLSKLGGDYEVGGFVKSPPIDDWFGLRSVSGGRQERYIANGNLLRARAIQNGGEILMHTMKGSTEKSPIVQGGILMPVAFVPGAASKSDFTIRYPMAAVDYMLALQHSMLAERFERNGYESDGQKAESFKAAMKFDPNIDAATRNSIVDNGSVLNGPSRGWTITMSRYDGGLRLYVGKAFPRIAKSKDLKALGVDLAKKRNEANYEATIPQNAATIRAVIRLLSNHSPLIVPDQAADIARELSRLHFKADNAGKEPPTPTPGKPMASRQLDGATTGGQPVEQVQALVDKIIARWENAPDVVVVESMDDERVPADIRADAQALRSQGTAGAPEGFFNPGDGKVYLIASRLGGDSDTVRVLLHEALGHFGLRGVYGAELGTLLDRMTVLQSGKVRDAARQLGYDFEKPSERRLAAEEVLAYMAQDTPELGWVQKTIAAIRTWLRDNIPGFSKLGLSDAEIIRDFIIPARQFVKGGGPRGPSGPRGGTSGNSPARAVFSRPTAAVEQGLNSARDFNLIAGYKVGDLFNGAKGRLNWWHKTVGTPYNLAQRDPLFRRAYESVQTFLGDVSYYAAEAADLAPNVLPKLEHFKDVWKSPLSADDTKALSAPVFEGTLTWGRDSRGRARPMEDIVEEMGATALDDKAHMLVREGKVTPEVLRMWQGLPMDRYESIINGKFEREFLKGGVVFTPAELREHFGLNDAQVGLYQEVRKSIDKSITDLAISDMVKFGGKDTAALRDEALATGDIERAGILLRDKLFAMAEADPARAAVLNDTANTMVDKIDKAKSLIAHGYAPLSRFGQYTLDVTDAAGERVYFGLFESTIERSKMARKMAAAFDGATITQGTVSQEAYKLFAGVSPETLELFGEMLGLESEGDDEASKAFQEYLKLAKSSRSAMKRLIQRKGIAGFSEDTGRVLAGFVYSNARQTASNLHMGEMKSAVSDIPNGPGQLKDEAERLLEYVQNPQEEAQAFRAVLFAQYLGGSVASAMVNAAQPFMVTLPYLSQFGGATAAARQMAAAVKDATKDTTGDQALDAALKKAEEEGVVSPQEVHHLQAQAMGKAQLKAGDGTMAGDALAKGSNFLSKLSLAWGKVFGLAEQFNRRTTFIAAYRTAVANGIATPAKFATKAVAETQFTYNKGNKPRWARGAVGSVLFTFKQFSVNYVELLTRMATAGEPGSPERAAGRRAALLALAVLFLMGGADGLPFVQDVQDLIDGALQRMGYNFSSKQSMKQFLAAQVGKDGSEFLMSGVSGLPGAPIDVSGRLGMGNLIPGTGLLQKKADHTRDLMELAGPAGDFAKRAGAAVEQTLAGEVADAATTISPVAARNLAKAWDMATTGMYRDDRGRKVIDTTMGEAVAKAIGFQPRAVAEVQQATAEVQREKAQYTLAKSEIAERWARAIFEGNQEGVAAARAEVNLWNERNPELPIRADIAAILRRVREMRKTKEQRVADSAPKAIRNRVAAELAAEKN